MASEAQIAANRANAQRSTGPRTAEGKARAAQNGLKHGLCARATLLPEEDPAEFEALVADLKARWRPADDAEMGLLLQYADATWRLERAAIVETGLLLEGWPEGEEAPEGIDPGVWGIGKAFIARSKEINRLSLHEARLSRRQERARKELEAVQAARKQAEAELASDSPFDLPHAERRSAAGAPPRPASAEILPEPVAAPAPPPADPRSGPLAPELASDSRLAA